ncbi:hypothetical protein G6F57_007534 [Rhizopus arrhizus]|uniref:RING-type domain-containing protein n=1 Tax=Rhizopus oryzae TaxID=64495 RepID=A0A9P6XBD7_RHIOR|nr:hypothetical protein G6F23_002519 [Rhizopus arrhizus]KAG1421354.1 hypothetical protein G6F58_003775 [Rhizopus delemar]KAG0767612.1 hypothetical protein G6F24_002631 [Rhizopus arrhizus]KAG0788312.1 hypothetical protein G6F21_007306 [Rhizopus arrhizus]KAG0801589.1 hypothetical protein G6F22_001096 [Rhizopus arrhizus]
MTVNLLNCSACLNILTLPITLSCGYTICLKCLPATNIERTSFLCPVSNCKKERHLFGPRLKEDEVIRNLLIYDLNTIENLDAYQNISDLLYCSDGEHLLVNPITNHCGHTFCRLCLLQRKFTSNSCPQCEERLPKYQFIQHQPINFTLQHILQLSQLTKHSELIRSINSLPQDTSFSDFTNISYKNIPIILLDFSILPSQKLRIPIYTIHKPSTIQDFLITSKESIYIYLAVAYKSKGTRYVGTVTKITSIEKRGCDILIDVIGLERFTVTETHKMADDHIIADIDMQFDSAYENCDQAVFLAGRIRSFIIDLAHSTPSKSFCNTVQGLLGPVWLNSVQAVYGPLPLSENPAAICWWAALVLPVGIQEKYSLLATPTLIDRLNLILSWIHDLNSQWDNCRQLVAKFTARIGQ